MLNAIKKQTSETNARNNTNHIIMSFMKYIHIVAIILFWLPRQVDCDGHLRSGNRFLPNADGGSSLSPKYVIGVHAVRASNDDGGNKAAIIADQIRQWLDRSNEIYAKANIEFSYDGTIQDLPDSKVNNAGLEPDVAHIQDTLNGIAANTGKLVICFRYGGAPGMGFSGTDVDYVIMPGFHATSVLQVQNIELLAHEQGHYFGLTHTFNKNYNFTWQAEDDFEKNGKDPSFFDDDKFVIGDTPPDPFIREVTELSYCPDTIYLSGEPFSPQWDNMMSYYHRKPVAGVLPARTMTAEQVQRVRSVVETRRGGTLSDVIDSIDPVDPVDSKSEFKLYHVPYSEYRAMYDRIWEDGYRLHLIKPYVVQSQVFYTATWHYGPEPEIQVYGWTYEDYRAKYDELWPQGWRLSHLEPYVLNGNVLYTAVWRKSTASEIQVYGWTYNDYRAKYDELWPQGWRLMLIKPFVVNGDVLYTAVWRMEGNIGEYQLYGYTYEDMREWYDGMFVEGWRIHALEPYWTSDGPRYTMVYRNTPSNEYTLYDWQLDDFEREYERIAADHFRMNLLGVYSDGSDYYRYSAAFIEMSG